MKNERITVTEIEVENGYAGNSEDPDLEFSRPYSPDNTSAPLSEGIPLDESQDTAAPFSSKDPRNRSKDTPYCHCQKDARHNQDHRSPTHGPGLSRDEATHRGRLDSTGVAPSRASNPSNESKYPGPETLRPDDNGYGSENDVYHTAQQPNTTGKQTSIPENNEYSESNTSGIDENYLAHIINEERKVLKKEYDLALQIEIRAEVGRLHDEYTNVLNQNMNQFKKDYVHNHGSELRKLKDENARLLEAKNNYIDQEVVIKDLRSSIHKLQSEALAAVDRFQPEEDTFFISAFENIDRKIAPLATLLSKQTSKLSGDAWFGGAQKAMMNRVRPSETIDDNDKEVRKQMFRSMIWSCLMDHVFQSPFQAFVYCTLPEVKDTAHKLEDVYKCLWPKPNQDISSTKWRSTTATNLMLQLTKSGATADYTHIITIFNDIFTSLGYPKLEDIKDKRYSGKDKLIPTLTAAVELAQKCATQRAIFDMKQPIQRLKTADSRYITNKQHDDEEERAGDIQFTIRPTFLKWGTGKGENLCVSTVMAKSLVQLK